VTAAARECEEEYLQKAACETSKGLSHREILILHDVTVTVTPLAQHQLIVERSVATSGTTRLEAVVEAADREGWVAEDLFDV